MISLANADAIRMPLRAGSVQLIVTSPHEYIYGTILTWRSDAESVGRKSRSKNSI